MKKQNIVVLVVCMMLILCACGSKKMPVATEISKNETLEGEMATVPEGMISYTVTVVDEDGNPVADAMVQMCKDSCIPGVTNEAGVATFLLYEDDYKVSMLVVPEGYTYAGEEEIFYFEADSYELTIVLKSAE